ncbi:ATP synthase subunit s, mitochondrial-like [Daktulosphaira vitifoliae]|uniref:ATP synthase subunit s, mitochondrial-like n=1 Tax=Daktulosphaira vitifoliae TaxID=58002 RepID=UPI0021AA3BAC|nr:ATP synthase subunit s, mitochondrial-like [Daktulosphaira vitifoliae]
MLKSLSKSLFWRRSCIINNRNLWQYINNSFNRVEEDRIKMIGSNIACAEWLMKNGAYVRCKGYKGFVNHYDCLPKPSHGCLQHFKIEEVFAGKDASISHLGFDNFENCDNISAVSFIGCNFIENKAMNKLKVLKNSLKCLKVISCVNVSNSGIKSLENLQ